MVDSHEVLRGEIVRLTADSANSYNPYPLASYAWSNRVMSTRERFARPEDGSVIEVGTMGHVPLLGRRGRIRQDAEQAYWVEDRSVRPHVVRWMLSSVVGDYASTFCADVRRHNGTMGPLYDVYSVEGGRIVEEMHEMIRPFAVSPEDLVAMRVATIAITPDVNLG